MDLNLLRTFVAVYELRSLTAAAERLFVSQPAVSQALGKLRRDLDDPLFSRDGRTMLPSRLAETLYPEFRASLARIDGALDGVRVFDAASSDKRFRIALSELGEIGYLPAILGAVRAAAPRVALDVVPLDIEALPVWLERGTVDLAITSSPIARPFERTTVKSERYVTLMSDRHPLASGRLSISEYADADHIMVSTDSGRPNLTAALEAAGLEITPRVVVNHFSSLPGLLMAGDYITTVAATLAAGWIQTWPIKARALPFDAAPAHVTLLVRSTSEQSAALKWFHNTVLDAIHSVPDMFWPSPT